MTYLLSDQQYNEFQTVSQLIRVFYDSESDSSVPFLFVKSGTLLSKFIFHEKDFELIISNIENTPYLFYALKVNDYKDNPTVLWSIVESQNEIDALYKIVDTQQLNVCVFNELSVNTFRGLVPVLIDVKKTKKILSGVLGVPISQELIHKIGDQFFDDYNQKKDDEGFMEIIKFNKDFLWKEVEAHYIPNRESFTSSMLSMSKEEGGQQEELILWLTDSLLLEGVVKNPQVEDGQDKRELCDILFSYEESCFIFESKSLSILKHDKVPDIKKLTARTLKHIDKALKQLIGASKNIRNKSKISDENGIDINIPHDKINHSVILIPDLFLLSETKTLGKETIKTFYDKTKSMLHILDTEELYRLVHASLMIASKGIKTSPIMAFDFMLTERIKRAVDNETPMFRFLLKIIDNPEK